MNKSIALIATFNLLLELQVNLVLRHRTQHHLLPYGLNNTVIATPQDGRKIMQMSHAAQLMLMKISCSKMLAENIYFCSKNIIQYK